MKINRQRFNSTEIFIFIEKIEILQRILVLFIEFHNRQQLSRRYKLFRLSSWILNNRLSLHLTHNLKFAFLRVLMKANSSSLHLYDNDMQFISSALSMKYSNTLYSTVWGTLP